MRLKYLISLCMTGALQLNKDSNLTTLDEFLSDSGKPKSPSQLDKLFEAVKGSVQAKVTENGFDAFDMTNTGVKARCLY